MTSEGYKEFLAAVANPKGASPVGQRRYEVLGSLVPDANRLAPGFNLYIVEDLGLIAGGVFMPRKQIVLYGRSGPKGQQRPTVLAHELGHALSLPHVVDRIEFDENAAKFIGAPNSLDPMLRKIANRLTLECWIRHSKPTTATRMGGLLPMRRRLS